MKTKSAPTWNSEDIKRLGSDAFALGVPKCENPYRFTSYRNHGVQKQAFWDAGWELARDHHHTRQRRG